MAATRRSILVINPNTTKAMTEALRPLVDRLEYDSTKFTFWTAPSGVPSINNEEDAATSMKHCMGPLAKELPNHDGFLVCCYSHHPLVAALRSKIVEQSLGHKVVTGIFESSVATCLQLLSPPHTFGIVSTGAQWSEILDDAVGVVLGSSASARYAGTETTGLNADELHSTPEAGVNRRMKEATARLLDKGVRAICLGCAGMAGMDAVVREACVEALGEDTGRGIEIVDGVVSGIIFMEGALRAHV